MFMDKMAVLGQAPAALNRPGQPWYVRVEGDSIVARWLWQDETQFAPTQVTREIQEFTFTVTLKDSGKYNEIDSSATATGGVAMSGGKLSMGTSSSAFKGHSTRKSYEFSFGSSGGVTPVFDTETIKRPVRAYLESCGWKKVGLFG